MRPFPSLLAAATLCLALPCSASEPAAAEPPPVAPVAAEPASPPPTPPSPGPSTAAADADADAERVSLDEIRRFVAVFRAVKQAYVDPIDDARLMQAAIRGLLTDLDPHSSYLDASQSDALNEMASGAYTGLGLEVVQQPDRTLLVVSPIDDTPAARAGILPGDLIVEIDGRAIDADNLEAAVESMRGEPGSSVELTLVRESLREPLKLTLVREQIRVSSVRLRRLEPEFAYLRISHFQGDTGQETRRKLAEMIAAGPPLKGLVLDLRRNPGGVLSAAVEAADVFLDAGTVVSTRGRLPFSISEFRAQRGDLLDGAPIVALTDSGTASAAEVLAAALRDRRRALIMGSTSFGKGSVQTVLPLDNGDALKLTTARYYGPAGQSIQASGIVPDVALPEDAVLQVGADSPPTLRERNLPRHLQSDIEVDLAAPPQPGPGQDEENDYLVNEALALLKGLALFDRRAGDKDTEQE
jgi:carboxyl-terminal processing protease